MKTRLLMMAVALMGMAQMVSAHNLTVKVKGASVEGKVYVSLFNSKDSFLQTTFKRQVVEAYDGDVVVVFEDIPAGTYAVTSFLDTDNDGQLGRGMFGMPTELLAVSNDASFMMGPPSFNDSAFEVNSDTTIEVELKLFTLGF